MGAGVEGAGVAVSGLGIGVPHAKAVTARGYSDGVRVRASPRVVRNYSIVIVISGLFVQRPSEEETVQQCFDVPPESGSWPDLGCSSDFYSESGICSRHADAVSRTHAIVSRKHQNVYMKQECVSRQKESERADGTSGGRTTSHLERRYAGCGPWNACFQVQGSRFRVDGAWFRVYGLGFGFWVRGSGFRLGSRLRV